MTKEKKINFIKEQLINRCKQDGSLDYNNRIDLLNDVFCKIEPLNEELWNLRYYWPNVIDVIFKLFTTNNKLNVFDSINLIEDIIYACYPDGFSKNLNAYHAHFKDYNLDQCNNIPNLDLILRWRSDAHKELINYLVKKGFITEALDLYAKYSLTERFDGHTVRSFLLKIINVSFQNSGNDKNKIKQEIDGLYLKNLDKKHLYQLEQMVYNYNLADKQEFSYIWWACKNNLLRLLSSINEISNEDNSQPSKISVHIHLKQYNRNITEDITNLSKVASEKDLKNWLISTNYDEIIYSLDDAFLYFNVTKEVIYYLSLIKLDYLEYMQNLKNNYSNHIDAFEATKNLLLDVIRNREDKVVEDIVLKYSDNSNEENKKYIIEFFENGYNSNFCNKAIIDKLVKNGEKPYEIAYNHILKNKKLTKQLGAGQFLYKTFKQQNNEFTSLNITGDFTGIVTAQIKSVERFVKEYLVQYYPDKIYKTTTEKGTFKIIKASDAFLINQNSTADDLFKLECGSSIYSLFYAMSESNENIPPVLNITNNAENIYQTWVKTIRNGHFHIHEVSTLDDANDINEKTAYWLMYLILSLNELKR